MDIPEPIKLEISKALRQLYFVDRSYGLGIWATDDAKSKWEHDLAVMRLFQDLKDVRLELLGSDRTVLFEFRISFGSAPGSGHRVDSANGIELPVLDLRAVADNRVIIGRNGGKDAEYRHLLWNSWTPATNHVKRDGDTFSSEHSAKITGGRQTGSIHVGAEARHWLAVYRIGEKGYAFAKDLNMGTADVFLHVKFAPPGFRFFVGQQLLAVVVQTPKGLQGRSIQAAPAA
jgi:hypothetical protein